MTGKLLNASIKKRFGLTVYLNEQSVRALTMAPLYKIMVFFEGDIHYTDMNL